MICGSVFAFLIFIELIDQLLSVGLNKFNIIKTRTVFKTPLCGVFVLSTFSQQYRNRPVTRNNTVVHKKYDHENSNSTGTTRVHLLCR